MPKVRIRNASSMSPRPAEVEIEWHAPTLLLLEPLELEPSTPTREELRERIPALLERLPVPAETTLRGRIVGIIAVIESLSEFRI